MATLRAQMVDIIYRIPDTKIPDAMEYLKKMLPATDKKDESDTEGRLAIKSAGINPDKAEAFAKLEEWRKQNKKYIRSDIDYKQVMLEAIDEKYGPID